MEQEPKPFYQRLVQLSLATAGVAVVAAAVVRELRKPSAERTWHGQLGAVPYDFRRPTLARLREAWWNPRSNQLFTPRDFGVGWALNLPVLFDRVRAFAEE